MRTNITTTSNRSARHSKNILKIHKNNHRFLHYDNSPRQQYNYQHPETPLLEQLDVSLSKSSSSSKPNKSSSKGQQNRVIDDEIYTYNDDDDDDDDDVTGMERIIHESYSRHSEQYENDSLSTLSNLEEKMKPQQQNRKSFLSQQQQLKQRSRISATKSDQRMYTKRNSPTKSNMGTRLKQIFTFQTTTTAAATATRKSTTRNGLLNHPKGSTSFSDRLRSNTTQSRRHSKNTYSNRGNNSIRNQNDEHGIKGLIDTRPISTLSVMSLSTAASSWNSQHFNKIVLHDDPA
jgi:hypothetical protein